MTRTRRVAIEYQRRKKGYEAAGYRVDEYGWEDLIIIEMYVAEPRTGEKLVRKQEGIRFRGRNPLLVECRKLMALDRLAISVPYMWVAHNARGKSRCRPK